MTCEDTAALLIDLDAGTLAPEEADELRRHLDACARCAATQREEALVTQLLRGRLARPPAPRRLRSELEAQVERHAARPGWRPRRPMTSWFWPVATLAACGAAVMLWLVPRGGPEPSLVDEAVNDHLRAMVAERPDIESGGVHQVRPWFEGRVDFAPPVPDLGKLGAQLRGGSVGYFRDRRAAVLQYQVRLHRVTLLVFRGNGLALPPRPGPAATARGIHAILWRDGALGLALVSDVDAHELERIAASIGP